jgi:beta-glucanase (GH16 family)
VRVLGGYSSIALSDPFWSDGRACSGSGRASAAYDWVKTSACTVEQAEMTTTTEWYACDGDAASESGSLPHFRSRTWRESPWLQLLLAAFVLLWLVPFAAHAGSDLGGWVPIWSDEFDYSGEPDPSRWTVLDRSHAPADNVFVDGSTLVLRVDESGNGANVGTGNTTSIRYQGDYGMKYLFTPGRLDIRARMLLLPGIMNIAWGSTDWLSWKDGTKVSGEIDLFEILGSQPELVYITSHFHLWFDEFAGTRERISKRSVVTEDTLDEFHIYTLEWDENQIRMYFDGSLQIVRNYSNRLEAKTFVAPRPLILNVYHVGPGNWGFSEQPLDTGKLPDYMKVDYVRYYQCPLDDCRQGGLLGDS